MTHTEDTHLFHFPAILTQGFQIPKATIIGMMICITRFNFSTISFDSLFDYYNFFLLKTVPVKYGLICIKNEPVYHSLHTVRGSMTTLGKALY